MRRIIRRIIFGLVTLSLTFVGGLYLYLSVVADTGSFWRNINGARVTANARVLPDAQVWRRPDGMLLINLAPERWYVYWPQVRNVGSCNPIQSFRFPGFVYARNCDGRFCPCVEMGTAKIEVEPAVTVEQNSFEFSSLDHERIRISW